MKDVLIGLPAAIDDTYWTDENPRPQPSVLAREWADQRGYLWTTSALATRGDVTDWPPEAYLIGVWEFDGALDTGWNVDHDAAREVFRLYNDNGDATGIRSAMYWQGHAERKELEPGERYADNRRPFTLRMTRQWISDANPAWSGWGWRVDMLSDDPQRDITARAIGIYDENWIYQYTTGAFVLGAGGGGYFTECPVGQRKADPEPIYYALLLGAAQEGRMILDAPEDGAHQEKLFWSD
jgi:hypothetical protein